MDIVFSFYKHWEAFVIGVENIFFFNNAKFMLYQNDLLMGDVDIYL